MIDIGKSNKLQEVEFEKKIVNSDVVFGDSTLAEWRFRRMYGKIDPILNDDKEANWLTVGDGRFGCGAQYISQKGIEVTASDIYVDLLNIAKQRFVLKNIMKINAEDISLGDNSFDYVLCKEAYHHFPRPGVALYEMLRVAQKGIVLIEPNDLYCTDSIVRIFFRKIISFFTKILFKTPLPKDNYESVGNYVYRISVRELEKVAICLDFPCLAYMPLNDYFISSDENDSEKVKQKKIRRMRRMIKVQDFMTKIGLYGGRLLMFVIFKEAPSETLLRDMKKTGYVVVQLPRNSHI